MSSDGWAYLSAGVVLLSGVLLAATMWTTPLHGRPNRWLVVATAVAMTTGLTLTLIFLSIHERGPT